MSVGDVWLNAEIENVSALLVDVSQTATLNAMTGAEDAGARGTLPPVNQDYVSVHLVVITQTARNSAVQVGVSAVTLAAV